MKITDGIKVFSFGIEKVLEKYGKRLLKNVWEPCSTYTGSVRNLSC